MKQANLLRLLLLLIAVAVCVAGYIRYEAFLHDDAYISLRYVHNFLDGHGLVWNPGERVEGYTNFLLVLWVSLLGRLGLDLVVAAKAVGVLSFILLNLFIGLHLRRYHARQHEDQFLWLIPIIVTLTAMPLIAWSLGGLETVLFAFLSTIGLWYFAESLDGDCYRGVIAGTSLGLAALARPEGVLFVVLSGAFGTILLVTKRVQGVKWLVGFLGSFLCIYLPFWIFALCYYGELLPNTWYVKGDMNFEKVWRGLVYLGEYSLSLPWLIPILIALVFWLLFKRAFDRKLAYLGITVFLYLEYVKAVGGDHMPAFRFIAPIIPSAALLLYLGLRRLIPGRNHLAAAALTGAVTLLCALQLVFPAEIVDRARLTDGAGFLGKIIGEYVESNWPKGSLIALNTAGSTPYYAPDMRFIDMLGLNDTTIARRKNVPNVAFYQWVPGHEKGDGKYVMSRKPDFIICGGANGDGVKRLWFLTEYELARDPEFEKQYQIEGVMITVSSISGYENYTDSKTGKLRFLFYRRIAK